MKRKGIVKLLSISLVLILIVVSLMLACSPTPTPTTTTTTTPPPTQEIKTLKIGATMPMNSPFGLLTKKAYEVLIPMFNEAGGLVVQGQRYNIEMIIYDDNYEADKARAGTERLVYEDKVQFLVGFVGSGPTAAAITVSEPNNMLLLANCLSSKFLEPPNRYTVRPGNGAIAESTY